MEKEKRIPRFYKISLFGIGSVFSIYEKRKLQEEEYHREEERELPIYRLEQRMNPLFSNETNSLEKYLGFQVEVGTMKACNSFIEDDFFYDKDEGILLYMNTCIYAEQRKGQYFDLVTGIEIPKHAIEEVKKVITIDDYIQFESNLQAIVPYVYLYQKQFMDILSSYSNKLDALVQQGTLYLEEEIKRSIPGSLEEGFTFEQVIDYKRKIVDSGLAHQIEFYMEKITQKRNPYYRVTLQDTDFAFSLYEERELQKEEYTVEEKRNIPIYKLEQQEMQVQSTRTGDTENYIGFQRKVGTIEACNSFVKDGFFYDEEEKIVLYTNTLIYVEQRNECFFDLVTGFEIPKYAIRQIEKVTTLSDYIQLESNMRAIVPYTELYEKQLMEILIKNKNKRNAIARLQEKEGIANIEIQFCNLHTNLSLQQFMQCQKEIEEEGIKEKIDFYVKKIGQKRK